ncbi:Uncharacterised protein [Vibrio cholerae]|nr:Uncharacterised protein [Vibrio cholerae]
MQVTAFLRGLSSLQHQAHIHSYVAIHSAIHLSKTHFFSG